MKNSSPLARKHWNRGQILAFSALDGPTDYSRGLVGRTTEGPAGIEITDPGRLQITFRSPAEGEMVFAGDFFRFSARGGNVCGVLLDAHHLLVVGNVAVSESPGSLQTVTQGDRLLVGSADFFEKRLIETDLNFAMEARGSWVSAQPLPRGISAQSQRTLLRALTIMKGQIYSPEGCIKHRWSTPDRWPHKDMWLWDTAFHAIGWRHVDPELAMEIMDGLFDLQKEDGFLTYRGSGEGPASHLGDLLTQPPVLAYAAKLVYEKAGDLSWLERLYPRLCAYVEWDFRHRDSDGGGLVEWYIEDDETCRSGESGMDNSPRFDSARPIDAVDFNAYLAAEYDALATIARSLGRLDDNKKWLARHQQLAARINERMWFEQEHFYCDYDPKEQTIVPILSSAGFLPLYGGVATEEQCRWLARHLADPEMFATATPVASVAVKDQEHYAKDMWRGPVWMNVNWMVAEGFARCGLSEQAAELRSASLAEIERTFEKFGTFFEYFDDRQEVEPPDLLRKGENAPLKNPFRQVIHDFGWTATLYVDLLFRTVATPKNLPVSSI